MRNLLVVTNRAPFSYRYTANGEILVPNVGGVATTLDTMLRRHGDTWVCWGDGKNDIMHPEETINGYTIDRIFLTKKEKIGFYNSYSNRVLWPLFHYFRDNIEFDSTGFKYYYSANEKFARKIKEKANPETIIWIHDYQLMMVPSILRTMDVPNYIIFSWHIPWVSPEFFSILPEGKFLLQSVSKSNLLTFHTKLYEKNFFMTLQYEKIKVPKGLKSLAVPLGIDTKIFSPSKHKTEVSKKDKIVIIFSIDRLDYTKGLIQRVRAIEKILGYRKDLIGKFVYIMNVTPSRTGIPEYEKIKNQLEMEVGKVNGLYSTTSWIPIVYMYRKISSKSLQSLYARGNIALITPLIDGLNLVCKEYVATTKDGILILSKFAGAAEEMEGALKVNPNNINELASSIVRAMEMDKTERMARLEKLKKYVRTKNSDWWYKRIIIVARRQYDAF
ncbi:trehalose-6-phosphate synthase [Ferroplasma sp.]|jgi:trehalose 6-phosphate synthase|uniref:alpha,alpha-trehalose-phosphate synthase (UDP-forming) n=1 Tax=Ferroplasma sp. TaxID=2591003 RepID=UPI0026157588|nr:trehalose-6-phosphate synthase [Ferroplasma sp.]